jgi:two-component system CheB/CheR fusion protein
MIEKGAQKLGAARSPPARRSSPRRRSPLGHDSFPVVGLGASAGGLDAFRRLLTALPPRTGMAFILIQHLDPTHASMMVDLLAGHTPMTVQQAADGMPLEREHVYLIPPGSYLSIRDGALRLSEPLERHGARLPYDFFLRSLAEELGERAICVILSGTGGDGSLGLKAVKEKGGLVIAQDPAEAEYDGMPRSAILTGIVDLVLPVGKISKALANYGRQRVLNGARKSPVPDDHPLDLLAEIVDLLRTKTSHDFSLYKPGTLLRRIERRMALAGADDSGGYLDRLRQDPGELELLAKDLLINVTSFFRDSSAFEFLVNEVIPDLSTGTPWTGRCGSGLPAAAPARRPIRSPCSFSRRSRRRNGTSSCRFSPPMSTRRRSLSPARDAIRNRLQPMCRRRGSPASLHRRTTATGWCQSCAGRWSSRRRMCWPIRRSRAST